jgi:hypothetical protein
MKTSFHPPTGWGSPPFAPYARLARAAGLLLLTLVCACDFGGSDEDAGTPELELDGNFAFDAPYSYDAGGTVPHDAGAHGDAQTAPVEDAEAPAMDAAIAAPDAADTETPSAEAGADAAEVTDASVVDATAEGGPAPIDAAADAALHDATVANLDAASSPDVEADVGTVTVPPALTLTVSGFPTPRTAGVAGGFAITALDAANGAATGYRGTVHCTSSDPQATLPASYTFVGGDEGTHTFQATFVTAGTRTLTCADAASLSGSESVTVTAAAAANVAVDGGNTQSGLVGTALANPLGVLVTDKYGNAVPDAQVTWTSTAGGGSLATGVATTTSTTGTDGVATVIATLGAAPGSDAFEGSVAGAQTTASFSETALADVTVAPNPVTTVVGHTVAFTASGGTGTGYVYSLPATSTSAINPSTGVYLAGPTPGTDTVLVVDSAGHPGSAQVIVNPHVAFSVASLAVQPRAGATLGATGGIAPYTFAFASTGNRSNGSLGTAGAYTAGAPDKSLEHALFGELVDNALVTDATGDTASLAIKVTAGPIIAPWGMELTAGDSFCFGTVLARASSGLHASGGSGTGYTFTLAANASGGTINATDGCYTPGTNGANELHVTDVVEVTDSLGNVYGGTNVDVVNTTGTRMIPSVAAISADGGFRIAGTGGTGPYTLSAATNESGGQGVVTGMVGALSTGTSWNSGVNGGPTTTEIDSILVTDMGCPVGVFCLSGDGIAVVTPTPALSPSIVSVYPGDPVTFIGSGGAFSGYVYALGTNNSGGSIDAAAGTYVAGATTNASDIVTITDGNGATSSASIRVLPLPAVLRLSPAAATIPPGGAALFRGGGGTPPYKFSVNTADVIDATSGYFRASATRGAIAVVTVTDALNNTATALVTVGAALSAQSSPNGTVSSGDIVQFTATGGAASDHEWQMTTNNSGGFIGRNTGIYQGGCAQGSGTVTDVVQVTDLLGNTATAKIAVSCEVIQ